MKKNILIIKRELNIIKLDYLDENKNVIDRITYQIKNMGYEAFDDFKTTIVPFFKKYFKNSEIIFLNERHLLTLFVKLLKICIKDGKVPPIRANINEKKRHFFINILKDIDTSIIESNKTMTFNLFRYFDYLVLKYCWLDIGKKIINNYNLKDIDLINK